MFGFDLKMILGAVAGISLGLLVGWAYSGVKYRAGHADGWNAAVAEVERMNRGAADAARKARKSLDDCYDSGADWDVSLGLCVEPKTGQH